MVDIKKETIEAYALENAILHDGKAVAGSVLNSLFAEGLKKEEIKEIMPNVQDVLENVNSLTKEKQEARFKQIGFHVKKRDVREKGELPELPKAEKGKVVMRSAPYPSGPLHIGNTRQAIINDEYAKKYKGKMILVIDDTIGSEEKPIEPEAYKLIPEGLDWLGVKYDKKIVYKSDRLKIYYEHAEELIKKGYMYVCSCSQEEMRDLRTKGIECSCRELPGHEQLERWKKMFKAKEGEYTVRLKTNMQDPNPAFRDRVMFRISERIHPRVRDKYKVWPLLEFSWAIDDHLLGMTHIIRGIDLMMETKVEEFIWDIFKWGHPVTLHTGFFQIEGVKISKSKGAREVKSGQYIGWNDPRLWSLQSLRDRGILPESIREFCVGMGMTKSNSIVAVDVLYSINKKHLEKVPRYFFVENPEKLHIGGAPDLEVKLPMHPDEKLKLGHRVYKTGQDFYISGKDAENLKFGNYRFMHLFNFKFDDTVLTKEPSFSFISEKPDDNLDVKYLQWLSADAKNISVEVRMDDGTVIFGLGEPEIINLKKGEIIQFERFGFVRLHNLDKKNNKAEFWFAHK